MRLNSLKRIVWIGLMGVAFTACKSRKVLVALPPVVKTDPLALRKSENLQLLRNQNADFKTLSLKGKAKLLMDGQENNVNVNIRILKDKKIWLSMTAIAGIEVARALITPDSLSVRNNLEGLSLQKPFNYIHRYANKDVNFQMLQELLAGSALSVYLNEDSDLVMENGVWLLNGRKNNLGYQIVFNTLLKASQTNLNDLRASQSLKVVYGDYQKINDSLYPTSMQLNSVSGVKRVSIAFDFTKIESNVEMDFSFSVPKRFKVIN